MNEELQRQIHEEVKSVFKKHGARFSDVVKKNFNRLSIDEAKAFLSLSYHSALTTPPMLINYLGFPSGIWNRSQRTIEKYKKAA